VSAVTEADTSCIMYLFRLGSGDCSLSAIRPETSLEDTYKHHDKSASPTDLEQLDWAG
jgi:hypothetical protein